MFTGVVGTIVIQWSLVCSMHVDVTEWHIVCAYLSLKVPVVGNFSLQHIVIISFKSSPPERTFDLVSSPPHRSELSTGGDV